MNPCKDFCYTHTGKEYSPLCDSTCEFAKAVSENRKFKETEEAIDRPAETLRDVAEIFCTVMDCRNCPVVVHGFEARSEHEKYGTRVPCVENLVRWIKEETVRQKG